MGEIIIAEPVLTRRRLTSKVSVSEGLEKYLKEPELFIEYDADINANTSVLNIPLTATILPLAWLTGSNIIVGELDETFKESMDNLKLIFQGMFPLIKFRTRIISKKLIQNQIGEIDPEQRTGLFFSGGVDSTYSLVTNLEHRPRLLMCWGVDNFGYPGHSDHWNKVISTYHEFAQQKKLIINTIKTNISQILDDRRIEHRFFKELYDGMLRPALQQSLMLLSTAAPLSVGRFDRLLIAASYMPDFDYSIRPRATIPRTDENIVWANLRVKHDGYILRNNKIMKISEYLQKEHLPLRVCLRSNLVDGYINDGECEKCLRTIAVLALNGIDPKNHGFKVDNSTFPKMRTMWENMETSQSPFMWTQIRDIIPENIENDLHGSQAFFEWFRGFDFNTTTKNWIFTDFYHILPYRIAQKLDQIYNKLDINIHDSPTKRNHQ